MPFKFHAPGYNFLGPRTKSVKRLSRGDDSIYPLDASAKEHDECCTDHPLDRSIAAKIVQEKLGIELFLQTLIKVRERSQ